MRDLKSFATIWIKGILILVIGVVAAVLLLVEVGTPKIALLLGITIWAFCRAYYFAFYVVEKYVDPGYRFSGLMSFLKYCLRSRHNRRGPKREENDRLEN